MTFPTPLRVRFWAKVEKSDGCWNWTAGCDSTGYGALSGRKGCPPYRTHRLSWEIHNGPIPAGMFVCHTCDNRRCVRPDHLFLGTAADNLADMTAKGRRVKGERVWTVRLTPDQVREIRRRYAAGEPRSVLIAAYGISPATVGQIVNRVTWKHIE